MEQPSSGGRRLALFLKDTCMGGAELSLLALISFLRRNQWSSVFINHRSGDLFQNFCDATKDHLTLEFPYPRQPASWIRLIRFLPRVRKFLGNHNPEILLSGDFYTLWATLFFRSIRSQVFSIWQGEYRFDDSSVLKWIQYGAGRASRLLASEPVAAHANQTGLLPRHVETLNPPVDEEQFNPEKFDKAKIRRQLGWGEDQHIALCAARIGEGKGQLWLAQEFLRENLFPKSARLVFVGPGECVKLRALATGSGGRVLVLGARNDLPALLAASDLAIQPGTLAESFGMSALEAILMRKNLLAFAVGAIPYTLGAAYQGLHQIDKKDSIIKHWLSLSISKNAWLPDEKLITSIVERFGRRAWCSRVNHIFQQDTSYQFFTHLP